MMSRRRRRIDAVSKRPFVGHHIPSFVRRLQGVTNLVSPGWSARECWRRWAGYSLVLAAAVVRSSCTAAGSKTSEIPVPTTSAQKRGGQAQQGQLWGPGCKGEQRTEQERTTDHLAEGLGEHPHKRQPRHAEQ
jgi:hypothetical protein